MALKKNRLSQGSQYTVSYSGMRGVDFSSENRSAKRYRYSYLENMYRDYSGGGEGITESVPGFRKVFSSYQRTNAIYMHKDANGYEHGIAHCGTGLIRFKVENRDIGSKTKLSVTMKNSKSCGFVSGSDLYILDGESVTRVRGDGSCSKVGDETDAAPYIPTVYLNGEEHEQRNLLTEKFKEKFLISTAAGYSASTEGLQFKITSTEDMTASVSGLSEGVGGVIYIPSYASIAGERYKVTEIQDNAFYANHKITEVIISDSVIRIGKCAFISCTKMTKLICGAGVETIDSNALLGCESLTKLYIGRAVKKIGVAAFNACLSLEKIDYAGTSSNFNEIDNQSNMGNIVVNYEVKYNELTVEIPIFSPANSVEKVEINGTDTDFSLKTSDSRVLAVLIHSENKNSMDGSEITVHGSADPAKFTLNSVGTNFISEEHASITGKAAIFGCTVCENFDGRIFLSGNPKLPNTVFYSSRDDTGKNNPLYFGILNYFNDGVGSFTVKAILAGGDSLAVFKSGDDGGGSIYYHTPKETGIDILPKIYPVSYVHSGISAVGEAISFFDDPIFLSPLGCTALDKKMINLERSVTTRSSNVNAKLLCEDLSKASLAKWCGYLVVQTGEHIYLADSRQTFTNSEGRTEYEWYYLSGIGAYLSARKIFKYSETAKEGYSVKYDKVHEEVLGEVYMKSTSSREIVYFTTEDGIDYEVYTDGEMREGNFYPASCVCAADGDLLFFGTTGGDICVFNNDKRGLAPDYIKGMSDFDEAEYKQSFGSRIHPYYYSFDNHAPTYALRTVSDDGSIPHFTKSTVKHSLTVKMRCLGGTSVNCEVGTDGRGYSEIANLPDACMNFAEFDFASLSFENKDYVTVALKEKEKGWIEKNIAFYSNKYMSPFGIYSITYRFSVKGRIK